MLSHICNIQTIDDSALKLAKSARPAQFGGKEKPPMMLSIFSVGSFLSMENQKKVCKRPLVQQLLLLLVKELRNERHLSRVFYLTNITIDTF